MLRESDLNPPNVRSKCILAIVYKANEHLDQNGEKMKDKQRERKTIQLYLHPRTEPEDEHLAISYTNSS